MKNIITSWIAQDKQGNAREIHLIDGYARLFEVTKDGEEWESHEKVFMCQSCADMYWGLLPDMLKHHGTCVFCGEDTIGISEAKQTIKYEV